MASGFFIVFVIQLAIEVFKLFFFVCRVVFELAFKLRLGFALVYLMIVDIFFRPWATAHPMLSIGILIALAALGILSWIVTLVLWLKRKKREERLIGESMLRNAIHLSHDERTSPEIHK